MNERARIQLGILTFGASILGVIVLIPILWLFLITGIISILIAAPGYYLMIVYWLTKISDRKPYFWLVSIIYNAIGYFIALYAVGSMISRYFKSDYFDLQTPFAINLIFFIWTLFAMLTSVEFFIKSLVKNE